MAILLLETLHPEAEALLAAAGEIHRASATAAPHSDTPWERITAVLTRGRGQVNATLVERCPSLKVVARAGVGLDNVDLESVRRRGAAVIYTPGVNTATVAEHTLTLLLTLVRDVLPMAKAAAGSWQRRDGYRGDEIGGKTLGIIGFGAIGRRVAALAQAFDMKVIVARHEGTVTELPTPTLPTLLGLADVVTLHAPLTDGTRGLIGARELRLMKPGAFLVNTARGALIDQRALEEALKTGHLGGFAADVLDPEPPAVDEPLVRSDRVVVTPHVASLTARTYREMCLMAARNVIAILDDKAPDESCRYQWPNPK